MYSNCVIAVDADGHAETVAEVENQPSGLGWLPDGRLLVISMIDRRVLKLDNSGLTEHADLSGIAEWHCNDMVVDAAGRAYVGNFGFDLHQGATRRLTALALVEPAGRVEVAADDLSFPNGMVISSDRKTLIVAETLAGQLTAFDIADDGALSRRRVYATLDGAAPDGICLDSDGGVWVASPTSRDVLRVCEGGEITHRVDLGRPAFACMLGGTDRRTLFVCTASTSFPDKCRERRDGRIECLEVDTPGAGWP
jgi:sugar lactone lactonase YvrE